MTRAAFCLTIWAFALAGFVLGCFWAGRKVAELETDNNQLAEQVKNLTATQDHRGCQNQVARLSADNAHLWTINLELNEKVATAFEFGRLVQYQFGGEE